MVISTLVLLAGTALAQTPEPALPALYIIGDSTVRNGRGDGAGSMWGWGDPIAEYFDASRLKVVNKALGGRSSRTFITGGQWAAVKDALKPGDFLIMQFGHNDSSPVNDKDRARGTMAGTGEESKEIDNMLTGKKEVVYTFGHYMREFIREAKAKGAKPIICSPVPRNNIKDGKVERRADSYPKWAADLAKAEEIPFIDLFEIIAARYEQMGPEKVNTLFPSDHTHTSREGAEINARAVITGLKALKENPLAPYFSEKAKAVQ